MLNNPNDAWIKTTCLWTHLSIISNIAFIIIYMVPAVLKSPWMRCVPGTAIRNCRNTGKSKTFGIAKKRYLFISLVYRGGGPPHFHPLMASHVWAPKLKFEVQMLWKRRRRNLEVIDSGNGGILMLLNRLKIESQYHQLSINHNKPKPIKNRCTCIYITNTNTNYVCHLSNWISLHKDSILGLVHIVRTFTYSRIFTYILNTD